MSIKLMYITNNVSLASIADKAGVDFVWIDLERRDKEKRQKNMDTVKSHHKISDIAKIKKILTKSKLLVRINPWRGQMSKREIDKVIDAGADVIMLPMWKRADTAIKFLNYINKRVETILLLETIGAQKSLDKVLLNPLVNMIHIGLNDLSIEYNKQFMFQLLTDGTVDEICNKIKKTNIEFGFGGIARLKLGDVPAEYILKEHYALGSTMAILSRSFCSVDSNFDYDDVNKIFVSEIRKIRKFENRISEMTENNIKKNRKIIKRLITKVVNEKCKRK